MPIGSKDFVSPDSPILTQKVPPIAPNQITATETLTDIERMIHIAYGEQQGHTKAVLVGLAAPQIGIAKRIILVDIGADGHGGVSDLQCYINPKIVWKSKATSEWYEGCYSTGHICGIVPRSLAIRLHAYNRDGKEIIQKFSGYVARIFQHEIDHLNGIRFPDHITDDTKLHWVEPEQFQHYRNNEAWRNWPNKYRRF